MVPVVVATGTIQNLRGATTEAFITSGKVTKSMVPQNGHRANQDGDLSWPGLIGKSELRGSVGIGLHVACWISEQQGYAVIPMWPIARMDGRKMPLEKWRDLEYRTPLEIRRDSKFRMKCGIAILAGKSGLVVIDIDDEESWSEFCAGRSVPRTLELSTHSGRHLVFSDKTGISYKTQGSQLATGVDVRGRGGLFVVYDPGQPERHFTDLTEPADLPAWLSEAIPRTGTRGKRKVSVNGRISRVTADDIKKLSEEVIPPGQHNDWLHSTAMSLANKGFTAKNRKDWYMIATAALTRSHECTDAKGNVDRNRFPDQDIMAYFDTAVETVAAEQRELKENPGKKYDGVELIQSAADVADEDVEWIWSRYLPRCSLTQLDGKKGHAKSFTLADIIARATLGRAMPGEEEAICSPMNVFVFTEEVTAQSKKKLRAAGADLSMVHYPHPDFREAILRMAEKRYGTAGAIADVSEEDLEILLPAGIDLILEMIRVAKAELVIWDPINHYVDPDKVNTHSDPAVRRALAPLVSGLERMNAAGITVRHLNKDERASAGNRGLGSTAFQNIGRVHLLMGKLADEHSDVGTFGLAMESNNYTVPVRGTLAFDVVDSDIKLDNLGHMVGRIEWRDLEEDIDTETLVRGNNRGDGGSGKSSPGPVPLKRMAIKRILVEMGEIKQVWDAVEARAYINSEMDKLGHDEPNTATVNKARDESFVKSKRVDVGKNEWRWPAQRRARQPRAHEA